MTIFIGLIVKFRIEFYVFSKGGKRTHHFQKVYALKGRRREITRTSMLSEIDKIRFKNVVMLKKFCKMVIV